MFYIKLLLLLIEILLITIYFVFIGKANRTF